MQLIPRRLGVLRRGQATRLSKVTAEITAIPRPRSSPITIYAQRYPHNIETLKPAEIVGPSASPNASDTFMKPPRSLETATQTQLSAPRSNTPALCCLP